MVTILNKSKFAMAIALSSCTLMGYFSHNEMKGIRPAADASGFSINYTQENAFSRFIIQQSSV